MFAPLVSHACDPAYTVLPLGQNRSAMHPSLKPLPDKPEFAAKSVIVNSIK
jgi:hypothetical protein